MFIAETWTDEARLDRVQQEIEFENKWVVSSNNRGGGLVLFWKASVNLTMEGHQSIILILILIKTLRMLCVLQGFMMNQKWQKDGKHGMISAASSIILRSLGYV